MNEHLITMSSRYRYLKSLALLALMLVGLEGISQTPLILEKVVARVGSEYILYSDIHHQNKMLK